MADNLTTQTTVATIPTNTKVATDAVTYSGDASSHVAPTSLVQIIGAEGSKTTVPVANSEDAAHASGDAGIMALAVRNDTAGALSGTDGDYTPLQTDSAGNVRVAIAAATNSATRIDDAAFTPATHYAAVIAGISTTDSVDSGDAGAIRMTTDRKLFVTPVPNAEEGCSIYKSLDLDESEEQVKATAGVVYGFIWGNRATAIRYLKFYNDTAANVIVGTTVPDITIALPANASDAVAGVAMLPVGIKFSTAITIAATTGFADNDTGSPGTNDIIVTILYK